MTAAKRQQLTRELDTRVCYLRLTGLDDTALVAAMSDRVADFETLLDAAGPGGMDGLAGRLPDLRHYTSLLTAVVRDSTIRVPTCATLQRTTPHSSRQAGGRACSGASRSGKDRDW